MTQVEITPFNAGQISQTNDVQTQNPVGNANNKSVQANRQWNKTSISKKSNARNSFTQNHKIGRRPSGSLSTPNTSLKGSKITIGTSGKRNSIIIAFTENCPSEEKLREFKEFFMQNWNDEASVKHKVHEPTGISGR